LANNRNAPTIQSTIAIVGGVAGESKLTKFDENVI
jgi:hypothetical protein